MFTSSLSMPLPDVSKLKVFNSQCIIECWRFDCCYLLIDSLLGRGLKGRGRGKRFQACKKCKRYTRKGGRELLAGISNPPPLLEDLYPNALPHHFWMPVMQANWLKVILIGRRLCCLLNMPLNFCFKTGAVSFGACSILQYEKVRSSYIHKNQAHFPTGSKKQFGIRDMVRVELLHECFTVYCSWIFISL